MGGGTADVGNVRLKPGDVVEYKQVGDPEYDLGWVTRIDDYKIWVNWLVEGKELWINAESRHFRKV